MAGDPKPIFVQYAAKDFLDGTQLLDPWEELAYRRVCDLIYATNDQVPDDDRRMAKFTKVGRRWPRIKQSLLDDGKLIATPDGRISNRRARAELEKVERFRDQRKVAADARWERERNANGVKSERDQKQKTDSKRHDINSAKPLKTQETDDASASISHMRSACEIDANSKPESESQSPTLSIELFPESQSLVERDRSGQKRATRLSDDWTLPPDWRAWAERERPDLDISHTAALFRDHWLSQPGRYGTKLDWLATWRNWVRRERAGPGNRVRDGPQTFVERQQQQNAEIYRASKASADELRGSTDGRPGMDPKRSDYAAIAHVHPTVPPDEPSD